MRWLSSLVIFFFLVSYAYADICLPEEQAKQIIVELKQKRILEEQIEVQEVLIENLKKQNELLKQQIELLKEQNQILLNQLDLYKTFVEEKEAELRKQKLRGFLGKTTYFTLGTIVGSIMMLLILK
jgi:stage III sporulation protein SpoIIIAA